MKEAIGNAFLFNIIITFFVIIMILLVSSLSYSKAFRVKNRIVEIIELNQGYNSNAKSEIDRYLRNIGYKTNSRQMRKCPTDKGYAYTSTDFRYCVYQQNTANGPYYTVATFIYFEFPIIGDLLEFPIYGETKIVYDL